MPPSATSNFPFLRYCAPVNAPFSWPNNSLSSSVSVRAPQWITTMGINRRGLDEWIARATTSFPVPLSPVISTVASVEATIPISSSTRFIPALLPTR